MVTQEIDLRTPLQKARDERNANIIKDFNELSQKTETKKWAIFRVLGEKYGLKEQGIRSIINKHLQNKYGS